MADTETEAELRYGTENIERNIAALAQDGTFYNWQQFQDHYGAEAEAYWRDSKEYCEAYYGPPTARWLQPIRDLPPAAPLAQPMPATTAGTPGGALQPAAGDADSEQPPLPTATPDDDETPPARISEGLVPSEATIASSWQQQQQEGSSSSAQQRHAGSSSSSGQQQQAGSSSGQQQVLGMLVTAPGIPHVA